METKTLKLLNLTPQQYEEKTLNTYVNWCATRTAGKRSLQKVLTCQPLFNWWLRELNMLENEFIKDMQAYPNPDPKACTKAYNFTIAKINQRFSKSLLRYAHDSSTTRKQNR